MKTRLYFVTIVDHRLDSSPQCFAPRLLMHSDLSQAELEAVYDLLAAAVYELLAAVLLENESEAVLSEIWLAKLELRLAELMVHRLEPLMVLWMGVSSVTPMVLLVYRCRSIIALHVIGAIGAYGAKNGETV